MGRLIKNGLAHLFLYVCLWKMLLDRAIDNRKHKNVKLQ